MTSASARRFTFLGANGSTANLVAGVHEREGRPVPVGRRDAHARGPRRGKDLWRSALLTATSWVAVDGYHYELTSVSRGDAGRHPRVRRHRRREDAGTQRASRKFPAGTYRAAVARTTSPATVTSTHAVDPGKDLGPMKNDLEVNVRRRAGRRSRSGKRPGRSPPMSGGAASPTAGAWSPGRTRGSSPGPPRSACRAGTRYVEQIDADLDFLQKTQTATLAVHMARWAAPPGHGRHARLRRPSERPVARRQRRA
jgi:hypothetical protein